MNQLSQEQSERIMALEQQVGDQQGLMDAMANTLAYARKEIAHQIGNSDLAKMNVAVMSIDEVLATAANATPYVTELLSATQQLITAADSSNCDSVAIDRAKLAATRFSAVRTAVSG